jgi:Family of unknown function (DUF5677)
VTLERDGFFSSLAERLRLRTREIQPFKAWFDYALGLNRLGYEMLRSWGTLTTRDRIALNASFVRVHNSFQSVLVLAERGLVSDARGVLRSAVEWAIAVHALEKDGSFLDQMIEARHHSERTFARKSLEFNSSLPVETLFNLKKAITDADAYEAALDRKLRGILWEQVALQLPAHLHQLLYQVFYRDLSSDGTHATLGSLERLLGVEEDGQITGIKAGPDTDGLVELLSHACLVFILSAEVCAKVNGLGDVAAALDRAVVKFHALNGVAPTLEVATSPL